MMRFAPLLFACFPLNAAGPFIADPYLQLGDARGLQKSETLALLWQTPDEPADWIVEIKRGPLWRKMAAPSSRRIAVGGIEPHLVWRATLTGLTPGAEFEYRLQRSGKVVFDAKGRARKPATQAFRFVAFGDCAAGTPAQKEIAAQTLKQDPDFVFIAGDIVY